MTDEVKQQDQSALIAEIKQEIMEQNDPNCLAVWRCVNGVDVVVDYLPEGIRNEDIATLLGAKVTSMKASETLAMFEHQQQERNSQSTASISQSQD